MTRHPSPADLAAFFQGELPPARARSVYRHLLRPCPSCLERVGRSADEEALEAALAEALPAVPGGYDAAIARAFAVARRHERNLRLQETQAREILARFEREDEMAVAEDLPPSMGMYARYRALLDRSWALRHEDPPRMIRLAYLAAACARDIEPEVYGRRRVFDFRCRAHAALANALRVAQQLDQACAAMGQARRLFELGTKDESLQVYLLEMEASLDADRRRFRESIAAMEEVYQYYLRQGDRHRAGNALVKLGAFTTYSGDPEGALEILRRSLTLLDVARDPTVVYAAQHNQVWILCDCGRFREAERELFELRPLLHHAGGRIVRLKLRWLEGRIDAGRDRLERAEETLREVRQDLAAANRGYDAALASLDLAAVLITRGMYAAATEIVGKAYQTFVALGIEREGMVSLSVLKHAFARQLATRTMVEEVAAFLRKLELDPAASFEAAAWSR